MSSEHGPDAPELQDPEMVGPAYMALEGANETTNWSTYCTAQGQKKHEFILTSSKPVVSWEPVMKEELEEQAQLTAGRAGVLRSLEQMRLPMCVAYV